MLCSRVVGRAVLVCFGLLAVAAACADYAVVVPEPQPIMSRFFQNFEALHPADPAERSRLLARLNGPGGEEWAMSMGFEPEHIEKYRRFLTPSEVLPATVDDLAERSRLLARLNGPGGEEWAIRNGILPEQVESYRRYLGQRPRPDLVRIGRKPEAVRSSTGSAPLGGRGGGLRGCWLVGC